MTVRLGSILLGAILLAAPVACERETPAPTRTPPAETSAQTSVAIHRGPDVLPADSLDKAIQGAQPGDVIELAPGEYRGPVVLDRPGVTLRGKPGARINANSAAWKPLWTRRPEYGAFAYTSPIPFPPGAMSIDGRIMLDARQSRGGLALHADGVGRNGRLPLGAIYTYLDDRKEVVVSFGKDLNPAEHRIEASPRGSAAVTIRAADRCRVEGLIVTGGEVGVLLTETAGSVVERCLVHSVDIGVKLARGGHEMSRPVERHYLALRRPWLRLRRRQRARRRRCLEGRQGLRDVRQMGCPGDVCRRGQRGRLQLHLQPLGRYRER